ncbi:MAG: hypothetical protein IIT65_07835 [Lachnospiraceae bacterium]|nr:hypothetical protein [Lachnospiraceae bacterium]
MGYANKSQLENIARGLAEKTNNALANKQNTIIFDSLPTDNSNNAVTSGGVKQYVDNLILSAINNSY